MAHRILSLLGGGAKGIFTLGVLEAVEAEVGKPLWKHFDLIIGTSTGAIIGSLLALGKSVGEITTSYRKHIPFVLESWWARERSNRLKEMADDIYKDTMFTQSRTRLAVVTTNLTHGRPTVFKSYEGELPVKVPSSQVSDRQSAMLYEHHALHTLSSSLFPWSFAVSNRS